MLTSRSASSGRGYRATEHEERLLNDSPGIKIGEWTATPALNLLERGASSVKLGHRAVDVLVYLARYSCKVVSVDELMASVWKGVVVGDGSVYLAINQLRRALGDHREDARYIETIPRRGYRLIAPVEFLETGATRGAIEHTGGGDRRHLGSDIVGRLLNELSRVEGLDVAGRRSLSRKAMNEDLQESSGELGVTNILEGTVCGDRVKVHVTIRLLIGPPHELSISKMCREPLDARQL